MGLFMQAPDVRCPEAIQEAKRRKKRVKRVLTQHTGLVQMNGKSQMND